MQQKVRSSVHQQEQVAGYSIDGSLKLMNHESFDKLSQRRLNQSIQQTRTNLIDRIAEKQAHNENDEMDGGDDFALGQAEGLVGRAAAAFGAGVETGAQHHGQQEDMQELQLQNLQKMMTDLNDDSTPSREKDQSSKAHAELYESSSQIKREMHELPQKAGMNAPNSTSIPINVSTSYNNI